MQPGDTFTTTIEGGPDAEAIYWGTTDDGHWLVTWASRHRESFAVIEGPKPSSEPFTIAPVYTVIAEGQWWIAGDPEKRRGSIIALGVDRYQARDEAANSIAVMAAQYARRVQELAAWRATR